MFYAVLKNVSLIQQLPGQTPDHAHVANTPINQMPNQLNPSLICSKCHSYLHTYVQAKSTRNVQVESSPPRMLTHVICLQRPDDILAKLFYLIT